MDFKYQEEWQYLTNICLNVTDACNLACRYCFVEQHPHFMTLQTAKDSADWLYKNLQIKKEKGYCPENEKCSITFFGGEPMLMYDSIIVPLVNYCNTKYPNTFTFGMTTNCTLLTPERIDFLYDNHIYPLLSLDGAKETQDYNRPCQDGSSSFDKIYKNIPYLLSKMPFLTFRSTIDQGSVQNTFKNYLFAEKLGFKEFYTMPNERVEWTQENKEILAKEVEKIFKYQIDKFLNNEIPINFSRINEIFEILLKQDINIASNNKYFSTSRDKRNVVRCGLGTTGGSIGYDGSIYGCQEQDSHSEKGLFLIGNIYNGGINIDKHIQFLKIFSDSINIKCKNEQLCVNCILQKNCHYNNGYSCPANSYDLFKDFNISSEMTCFWYQILAQNCLIMQQILVEQNCMLFKEYLEKKCNYKYYFKEIR